MHTDNIFFCAIRLQPLIKKIFFTNKCQLHIRKSTRNKNKCINKLLQIFMRICIANIKQIRFYYTIFFQNKMRRSRRNSTKIVTRFIGHIYFFFRLGIFGNYVIFCKLRNRNNTLCSLDCTADCPFICNVFDPIPKWIKFCCSQRRKVHQNQIMNCKDKRTTIQKRHIEMRKMHQIKFIFA